MADLVETTNYSRCVVCGLLAAALPHDHVLVGHIDPPPPPGSALTGYDPLANTEPLVQLPTDPPVTLDLTWMDGLQGILRDGELTPVFDRSDGVNPVGDRRYGATTTDLFGVEISFRSKVDSYEDDVNTRYGHALPVHPYCLPMLKALLARVDPDFDLGIAYRLFRLMGTVQGIYRKPEGCDYELYGGFKHVNGLDNRDALPYVVLSHDHDSWIFAPYMNPDPIATLDSPVVLGSAQRDSGKQVIPLLRLPDEILVTILNLVPTQPHYLYPGNQYIPPGKMFAFEHIMALQSSCSAVRNRLLNQGVAASFYRDFAKPYWTISRIRLPDGTLLNRDTTNRETFETALAKVHPWKWVSSCIKSDSSWNKHRVMMAFYRIVPILQNMVDEQGDWDRSWGRTDLARFIVGMDADPWYNVT
ncbi:hypothetical protein HDU87_002764 [Geranomyces variabilis]|uniref:Uncharacterized protein n=1 Tax=Geranomyces variabilis TaxID=109894 RepID=A0AAD5XRD2_9FUNG|nr:hypothetical protein HDU87_002764 [Geranomyces variabilis]